MGEKRNEEGVGPGTVFTVDGGPGRRRDGERRRDDGPDGLRDRAAAGTGEDGAQGGRRPFSRTALVALAFSCCGLALAAIPLVAAFGALLGLAGAVCGLAAMMFTGRDGGCSGRRTAVASAALGAAGVVVGIVATLAAGPGASLIGLLLQA